MNSNLAFWQTLSSDFCAENHKAQAIANMQKFHDLVELEQSLSLSFGFNTHSRFIQSSISAYIKL